MYSFPQCLHSFHIKDPAEFEFFLLGFLCPQGKYFRVFWLGMSSDSTLLWTVFLFLSYMSVCFFSALCSAILDPLFPCEKKHLPSVRKAVGVSSYLELNINLQCVFYCISCLNFFVKQVLSFQIFYRYSELFISQQVCFSCPQRIKYPFRKTMHYSSFNHWYSLVSFILWVSTRSAALSFGRFLAFSYSFPHETNFLLFWGLCWALIVSPGPSLVAASWGNSLAVVSHIGLRWFLSLWSIGSRVHGLQYLWHMGPGALWHVESYPTRDRTCVLRIGRQIPNHWTTKKVPHFFLSTEVKKIVSVPSCQWPLRS